MDFNTLEDLRGKAKPSGIINLYRSVCYFWYRNSSSRCTKTAHSRQINEDSPDRSTNFDAVRRVNYFNVMGYWKGDASRCPIYFLNVHKERQGA